MGLRHHRHHDRPRQPAPARTWSCGGSSSADRVLHSGLADRARATGAATDAEVAELSEGWLRWGAAPDAWFVILHGEVLCRA